MCRAEIAKFLTGTPVVVSASMPLTPSDGEVARRIVRTGLSSSLPWLHLEPGPKPHEKTHIMMFGGKAYVSAAAYETFKEYSSRS